MLNHPPQVIVLAFLLVRMGYWLSRDAQKDSTKDSLLGALTSIAITAAKIGVLYWGGFFDVQ